MGRIAPDPKTRKPLFDPPGQGYGPFKCGYCGRYGQPGACEGCGAPNRPDQGRAFPDLPLGSVMRSGILSPNEARVRYLGFPSFDFVKR